MLDKRKRKIIITRVIEIWNSNSNSNYKARLLFTKMWRDFFNSMVMLPLPWPFILVGWWLKNYYLKSNVCCINLRCRNRSPRVHQKTGAVFFSWYGISRLGCRVLYKLYRWMTDYRLIVILWIVHILAEARVRRQSWCFFFHDTQNSWKWYLI